MAKVRMRDTTAHADHGRLLANEVYELPDHIADHLVKVAGVAKPAHADTETYHERMAREADEAPAVVEEEPLINPQIERQVREAGTREGDRENATFPERQPLSNPPAHMGRARR